MLRTEIRKLDSIRSIEIKQEAKLDLVSARFFPDELYINSMSIEGTVANLMANGVFVLFCFVDR